LLVWPTGSIAGTLGRTAKSLQGERPATVIFKRESDASYTGTITGLQGPMPFKELKVDGDQVTANAEVDSPQAGGWSSITSLCFRVKLSRERAPLKSAGKSTTSLMI